MGSYIRVLFNVWPNSGLDIRPDTGYRKGRIFRLFLVRVREDMRKIVLINLNLHPECILTL